ncbi:MAG TPA: SCO family protein [Burkholderiaceae bacterium]|nr:SCO family protein [Burkholderiaceae bacterium]
MDRMTTMRLRAAVLALMLGVGLGGCGDKAAGPATPKASFHSVDITGAEYARTLELPDADGKMRNLGEFKGKVVVVFFGYTQCPDVCPTTMSELAQVRRSLGADGGKLQGIFVTIDPQRDTGTVLKAYVDNFGAGFVGLRGSDEQLKQVAREFKVFYAKAPGKTASTYTMDHTAGAYVFDTQGRIRLFSRYGADPKALEDDIRVLLREAAA